MFVIVKVTTHDDNVGLGMHMLGRRTQYRLTWKDAQKLAADLQDAVDKIANEEAKRENR